MIYYTLPILSFVIAFIRLNKRRCTPLVVILLLLCFVVGALRGEGVGADYYAYLRIFLHGDETMEAGFSELIRIIKCFPCPSLRNTMCFVRCPPIHICL